MRTALCLASAAAALLLGAVSARAQSPALLHDVLGDDPLARQIEQAPITSVTWVHGPDGRHVPLLLGQAEQPLGAASVHASAAAAGPLGGLAAHPSLAGLRDALASKKRSKAPHAALKQVRRIETRRAW